MVRMGKQIFSLKQSGQSVVEYVFLLVVVVFLLMTFFNSDLFQMYLGSGGKYYQTFSQQFEYSYRHGLPRGPAGDELFNPTYSPGMGETRFFGGRGAYPP